MKNAKVISFVATKDAAKAREFYEKTLGLKFVSEDAFAIVFDVNGVMLRVTKVEELVTAAYTVLGWDVADISAEVEELAKKGVKFERYEFLQQNELGVWSAPGGAKVAWFKDPNGNILSLTEFAKGK